MKFSYSARTMSGVKVEGSVDADDMTSAVRAITRLGHVPITLEPAARQPSTAAPGAVPVNVQPAVTPSSPAAAPIAAVLPGGAPPPLPPSARAATKPAPETIWGKIEAFANRRKAGEPLGAHSVPKARRIIDAAWARVPASIRDNVAQLGKDISLHLDSAIEKWSNRKWEKARIEVMRLEGRDWSLATAKAEEACLEKDVARARNIKILGSKRKRVKLEMALESVSLLVKHLERAKEIQDYISALQAQLADSNEMGTANLERDIAEAEKALKEERQSHGKTRMDLAQRRIDYEASLRRASDERFEHALAKVDLWYCSLFKKRQSDEIPPMAVLNDSNIGVVHSAEADMFADYHRVKREADILAAVMGMSKEGIMEHGVSKGIDHLVGRFISPLTYFYAAFREGCP